MTAVVELVGVRLRHGATTVLDGLSLAIASNEVVALCGPSGAGKTSALRVVLGLATPDDGTVQIDGRVASEPRRIVVPAEARRIGVVFQDLALWPHLTVHGNLAFGLHALARPERNHRIEQMLERVGLAGKRARYPDQLSGGERQRVAIARALVMQPRIVALDEPLANLDVALKHDLLDLFTTLLRGSGVATIYITHDPWEATVIGDRVAIVEGGRLVQAGTMDELRAAPASPFVARFAAPMR